MTEETPKKVGRPKTPDDQRKEPHYLSFTKSEWANLTKQSKAAKAKDRSTYIIQKLDL